MDTNKYIGEQIRRLRMKQNITQEELAEYLNTTAQTVSRYEIGDRKTNNDILFQLADFFKVSINEFFPPLQFDNAKIVELPTDNVKIPVLGKIPAGIPFEAIEDQYAIDFEEIPRSWLNGGKQFFALKLDGDSMEPEYKDNDVVIF